MAEPTRQDWLRALPDLKPQGGEHVGPCPLCGGTDRFRVNDRGAFCRQCLPNGKDGERYKELLQVVFGDTGGGRQDGGPHDDVDRMQAETRQAQARRKADTVTSWTCEAADGRTAKHHRKDKADGGKSFWWEPSDIKAAEFLYVIGDRQGAHAVITEGEKAADAAADAAADRRVLGTVGAAVIPTIRTLLHFLSGAKSVTLWPDNDEPGAAHMDKIGKALASAGFAVRRVDVDGLDEKDDAADVSAADVRARIEGAAPWGVDDEGEALPRAVPLNAIEGDMPRPLLSARDQGGAVLSVGAVCLLAGAGGSAKSALVLHIALGVAMAGAADEAPLDGDVFDGAGGPVLLATYEDAPEVVAWRGRKLAGIVDGGKRGPATEAMPGVHVLSMRGLPLFGPDLKSGGSYNVRPSKLAGWRALWSEAQRIRPRLVVIDPALAAYVGNSNDAAPVREFLDALTGEAKDLGCGVLIVAHSTKAARTGNKKGNTDPFDPGQIGGSAHWVDGVRGAMTLTWGKDGKRRLSIAKANYGPAYIGIDLEPIKHDYRAVVGFTAASDWEYGSGKQDQDDGGGQVSRNGRKKQETGRRNGKTADPSFPFGANLPAGDV